MSLRVTSPEIDVKQKISLIDDKLSFDQLLTELKNHTDVVTIGDPSGGDERGPYHKLNIMGPGRVMGVAIGSTTGQGAALSLDGAANGDVRGGDYFWMEHLASGNFTMNLRSVELSNESTHAHVTLLQQTALVPGCVRTQYSFQMCDGTNTGTTMGSGKTENDFNVRLTGLAVLDGTQHKCARVRVDYVGGALNQESIHRWSREFIIEGISGWGVWTSGNADVYGGSPAPSFVSSDERSITLRFNVAGASQTVYGCAFVTVSCPIGAAYITIEP